MRKILGGIVLLMLAGAGWASAAKDFYQQLAGSESYSLRSTTPPQFVSRDGDPEVLVNMMWEQGFVPVGISAFAGAMSKRSSAIAWGKEIGASHVIFIARYQSTKSGAVPLVLPSTSTTLLSGSASAFGSGGSATGHYSGSATTFGTTTTMIPWSVDQYQQTLMFFAPVRPGGTGMLLTPPTEAQRRALGTNRAFLIRSVRIGSPAYEADVMPGDIITEVDGQPAILDRLLKAQSSPVEHRYKIVRDDKVLDKAFASAPIP